MYVIPKSRTLGHDGSRTLLGRFRLVDFGVDVEVTLDGGMENEVGDSTGYTLCSPIISSTLHSFA